ncbi:MAG TPA: DNA-processing protein DprA [Erysipelothrix sp.]
MRNYLKNLAIHYHGNQRKIKKALLTQQNVPEYKCDCSYLTIIDKHYPARLLELYDPPFVLFYQGNLALLRKTCSGVIGSRQANTYALNETRDLVNQLKQTDVIVSGLAYGIDVQAHQTALDCDTIAILGNGLDCYYPYAHQNIQNEMMRKHLVISEFPQGVKPRPYHFPVRNRLIAALSDRIFIMAASEKSGTMHTANISLELNKAIYVLPHRVDEMTGQGCNRLILEGAMILTKSNGLYNI